MSCLKICSAKWDEDFMDLQEPENEEPAVVVPQKQPMAGMANIFLV